MQLWTIQTEGWLQDLRSKKKKFASYSRVKHDFRPHYKWMAQQMADRIGTNPERCPTFAWYKYFERHQRPDLRWSGHLPQGTPGVRVELEVNEAHVLLSQFELWHAVLNQNFLAENRRESDNHDELLESGKFTRKIMEDSWNRIFDLKFGDWRSWGKQSERAIQACIESVAVNQIRQVDHFIAR
ncbi:DUF3841 domain-containing protein [Gimesia fumaroli]|uniref:Uncharacterized protein n=1 Tax=Gimesia fumaroli TaxID=2527976 RepID=A0A518I6C3_9PLAN|nr:DUF3841 domain-containing protein [Gimesia fumaroli]QDV48620.1 hypothetical protein Enr17x_06330 [Gimesia fumaroli]